MSYPFEWWSAPLDPYKNDRIYLSDGTSTTRWFYSERNGDPKMIITYEQWKLIPKPEYKIEPLPFMMSNRANKEICNAVLDKANDRMVHGL